MKPQSKNLVVERAQPWLGTLVSMRVEGLPIADADRAIDAAFGEIATVHCLMSFHRASSDVSRLNAQGYRLPLAVHPWTLDVLRCALYLSALSAGCFDISVGAELVDWRFLPLPASSVRHPEGSWRDIELRSDGKVQFHRPLWIDLGGIAKGYAVDRATECLRVSGVPFSVVNAGGDIRVSGRRTEPVALDTRRGTQTFVGPLPVIELRDGSIASSSSHRQRRWHRGRLCGPHVNGELRSPAPTDRFACVIAEQCIVADGLTKVVMAKGAESTRLLRHFGASAHIYDPGSEWRHLETAEVTP
jgi:thiamine biosynthesis lipoprotein